MDLKLFMSEEDNTLNHDLFDKIIYINLKVRRDRKKEITNILARAEIPEDKIIRFEAISKAPGFLGCTLSHTAVMEMVIDNGWGNVLILEDDTDLYSDIEHIRQANKFLSSLKTRQWDVAFLGGNYYYASSHEPDNFLLKLKFSFCANAYIVNKNYAEKMLEILNESIEAITANGDFDESKTVDSYWCKYMEKDSWFGLYPCIAYQKKGYSNIRMGTLDYEYLFNKPLSDIRIF
ncbi:glycosyltransferase family 25 protein [Morganella psychrotolerans]|uniref:glycosyltransferase family 25 protein n=1 Tax=Morganella psychrotolerans TaxID=368603 RepID=UPI0039AFDB60